MKILYFHQHFSTPKGAVGIRSYGFARKLVARGCQVTMVCGSYGGGETGLAMPFVGGRRRGMVDGIEVVEFDLAYSNSDGLLKRAGTFFKFAARSVGLALTERYDVLFATTTPLTAGIPGIFARWLRGKPFVFEVRDLWPELPKAMGVIRNPLVLWAMSVLEWASYRSAHRLVGLSPGIVEGIARRGVAPERIALVPNGCDLDIFSNPGEPWRPAGVAQGDLMALYAGTHGVANGLDALLDAAAELKRRGRGDIKLLLIGQGKLKPSLQRRARDEALDNVVFHEQVGKARLAGLMASTDVGLQILANVPAFYYGTSPNKFFDYISAGLPVINNYPGWLTQIIEQSQCGIAVPAQDPVAFADALERAAADRPALREMGQRGRELAETRFCRDKLADEFVDWVTAAPGVAAGGSLLTRCFDVAFTLLWLPLLLPLLLLLAALVRVKLGAPVFFVQQRPGRHGRPFNMVKFRTMVDKYDGAGQLLPDAQRMTQFGSWLRNTSLDELPELFNVLKGEMSLVGPRPLLMEYLPLYTARQRRRHDVMPGITGWAQVNGRNALSWDEKFELDLWYVEHAGTRLNLRILWRTVLKVLRRDGISADGHATVERFTGRQK